MDNTNIMQCTAALLSTTVRQQKTSSAHSKYYYENNKRSYRLGRDLCYINNKNYLGLGQ